MPEVTEGRIRCEWLCGIGSGVEREDDGGNADDIGVVAAGGEGDDG